MKMNYIIILAIMAVACYFLFIRKRTVAPAVNNENDGRDPAVTSKDDA